MFPEERDAAYLWDMRDAARDIINWVQGLSYEQFCNNEMLQRLSANWKYLGRRTVPKYLERY